MLAIVALVLVAVVAGILLILMRSSALDRRPPLRMTKEYELMERAAEARRRAADAEEARPLLPGPSDLDDRNGPQTRK